MLGISWLQELLILGAENFKTIGQCRGRCVEAENRWIVLKCVFVAFIIFSTSGYVNGFYICSLYKQCFIGWIRRSRSFWNVFYGTWSC